MNSLRTAEFIFQRGVIPRNRRKLNLLDRPPIPPLSKDAGGEVDPNQEPATQETPPEVPVAKPTEVSDKTLAGTQLRLGRVSRLPQRYGYDT
jgi:hypothetical protein